MQRSQNIRATNARSLQRLAVLLAAVLLLTGWRLSADVAGQLTGDGQDLNTRIWNLTWFVPPDRPLTDNTALYADDQAEPIVEKIYLTILPAADGNATFKDMNQITDYRSPRPILPAVFSTQPTADLEPGTKSAISMEPGTKSAISVANVANATVTLRGHSTMTAAKKSYKIKLASETTPWQGQMVLNLNKHPNDESRMRNKVAFELFRNVPDLISMRTCFVRLFVRDCSSDDPDASYVDYGLFTHIEQPDRDFLKAHGLDPHGNLYKANNFEFLRYEDILRDVDDPAYDQAAFEEILEICAGRSHEKLLRMLADVNNENLDINKVLDRHFNRDNYFTWLAVNILLGNFDTQTQNYFLYSAHDSPTWYFLPWDYDGSMVERRMTDPDGEPAQLIGAANYWNTKLHQRVLSRPENFQMLSDKINEIHSILNREKLRQTILRSLPVVEDNYLDDPFFCHEFTQEEFRTNVLTMLRCVEVNHQLFEQNQEKPMPFFLGMPEQVAADAEESPAGHPEIRLCWGSSCDLQGDPLTYRLEIARDKTFHELVYSRDGLRETTYAVLLPPGRYCWRVMACDDKGNQQRAFDIYWDEGQVRNIHTGVYGAAGFEVHN